MRQSFIWIAVVCLCLVPLSADGQEIAEPVPEICSTSMTPEPLPVSTCTNCASCDTDDDCGTGSCVSIQMTFLICDEECSLPEKVCSLSCTPCTSSAQCPGRELCLATEQAFCIPEEECSLPDKVCEC